MSDDTLKGKVRYLGTGQAVDDAIYHKINVDRAVEKLKQEIDDLYHKIGKTEVWRAGNDVVCDMCEEFVKEKIDEVFGE